MTVRNRAAALLTIAPAGAPEPDPGICVSVNDRRAGNHDQEVRNQRDFARPASGRD
ncbi:MAG: hypothetical protein ACO208_07980 [Candidatus Puniceispirillaceae bacterium]